MSLLDTTTVLLLHFNESGGNFVDSSQGRRIITKIGSVSSSASSKFGANCFQGASSQSGADRLQVGDPSGGVGFPGPGTGPYTLDLWFYPIATPSGSPAILFESGGGVAYPSFRITTGGKLQLQTSDSDNNAMNLTGATTITLNQWNHAAVCKDDAGVTRLFLNGVIDASSGSMYSKSTVLVTGGTAVGASSWGGASGAFTGRIDELRYVIGLALFTADFSASLPSGPYSDPPAGPKLINTPPTKVAGSPMAFPLTWKLHRAPEKVRDIQHGGTGRVAGTVKEKSTPSNLPLRRRVWLMRERDGLVIRETWSDAVTGTYSFDSIDATLKYTVITYDYEHDKRAVIADNITPDPMP